MCYRKSSSYSCVLCKVDSITQEKEKRIARAHEFQKGVRYVTCLSCGNHFGSCCIGGLYAYLVRNAELPQPVRDKDECFKSLEEMHTILNNFASLTATITMAPCCIFSHTTPEGTKTTSSNKRVRD